MASIILTVLHFLDHTAVLSTIEQIQSKTRSGSINVIASYVDTPHIADSKFSQDNYFHYLFKPNELRNIYKGWELLHYEETENILHFTVVRMVARKI